MSIPAIELQRALIRRLAGRCKPVAGGVLAKTGERYDDCSSCEARCDGASPSDAGMLGMSGGVVVAPVWGGGGAIELRWKCPTCGGDVSQATTPLGSFADAAEVTADPLCYRCRRRP